MVCMAVPGLLFARGVVFYIAMHTKFYFDHDYGARNDDRVLELRAEFGWEGYGIFWALIETICENNGGIRSQALAGLGVGLGVAKARLEAIINLCLDKGLLYKDNDLIRNKRIDMHFVRRIKLSEAGRRGGQSSKDGQFEATLKPPLSQAEASKGKERKEEEKRKEEAKKKFDDFRKQYPGTKRGLQTEFDNFVKKHNDWDKVVLTLGDVLEKINLSRQKKKERGEFVPEWKHLQTWINQRCWEEEAGEEKNIPPLRFNPISDRGFYFAEANLDTLYVVSKKQVTIGFPDTEKHFSYLPDDTRMIAFKTRKSGLLAKYLGIAPLDDKGQIIQEPKKLRECLKYVE